MRPKHLRSFLFFNHKEHKEHKEEIDVMIAIPWVTLSLTHGYESLTHRGVIFGERII